MKLTFNPYTYVRVAVMRVLLLKREDYQRLLKMSFQEIIETLRQSSYKAEIEERALRYSGAALLEHALNANLKKTYQKLLRIADGPLRELIRAYLFRNDVSNVKTILRAKVTKMTEEEIREMLLPGSLQKPMDLLKQESMVAVIKASELFERGFLDRIEEFRDDLPRIENEMDKEYFRRMDEFSERISQGAIIKEFVKMELQIINLNTILKLKQLGVPKDRIMEFVIPGGLHRRLVDRLAGAKDTEELIRRLKGTPFAQVIKPYEREGLVYVEAALQRHLLKRTVSLMHKNLLTADVILAFMLSKEIEILNLRRIVKGKQLQIPEQTVEKVLVM